MPVTRSFQPFCRPLRRGSTLQPNPAATAKKFLELSTRTEEHSRLPTSSRTVAALATAAARPAATARHNARLPAARPTSTWRPHIQALGTRAARVLQEMHLLVPLSHPTPDMRGAIAHDPGAAAHARTLPATALTTDRMLVVALHAVSRQRLRGGAVVLLKVANDRCRAQEPAPYACTRRTCVCAVRGGRDGAVVRVTLSTPMRV